MTDVHVLTIRFTAYHPSILIVATVVSSPAREEAQVQSSLIAEALKIVHPNRGARTTSTKPGTAKAANCTIKPKHPKHINNHSWHKITM